MTMTSDTGVAAGAAMAPFARLGAITEELTSTYLASARAALAEIVSKPQRIDAWDLRRAPGEYTRNLLYGAGQMSVWAMVWAPGARTSIHDHHCSCCFSVVRGAIEERWFDPVDETRVRLSKVATREPGFIAAMLPSGPNVHQIVNDGDEEAISVHVYGFDHRLCGSSVRREYRLVEARH